MTALTEADLLRMREVQVSVTAYVTISNLLRLSNYATTAEEARWLVQSCTDWPRLTEWALEARRLLKEVVDRPSLLQEITNEWWEGARRLLGEP